VRKLYLFIRWYNHYVYNVSNVNYSTVVPRGVGRPRDAKYVAFWGYFSCTSSPLPTLRFRFLLFLSTLPLHFPFAGALYIVSVDLIPDRPTVDAWYSLLFLWNLNSRRNCMQSLHYLHSGSVVSISIFIFITSVQGRQLLNCLALRPLIGPNALPLINQKTQRQRRMAISSLKRAKDRSKKLYPFYIKKQ